MTQRQYRLDFRKEDVTYILDRVNASTSCSLVGVGSIGKSNLIAHLLNPVVHIHYLGGDSANMLKLINIDANMLTLLTAGQDDEAHRAWTGFELMMHRLFLAFYPFEALSADDARSFFTTYQSLQDGRNPLYASMGLRYFELGLAFFLRRGFKLVFLFDEFETMLDRMPVKFFLALRGLRDVYKGQLSYITFARSPLPVLIERIGFDALSIEPFVELFNDHVRYIGPYSTQDAADMVSVLVKRSSRPLSDSTVAALLDATGRFAGMIRAGWSILEMANNYTPTNAQDAAVFLGARKSIRLECRTIWDSLNLSEQIVLRAVARLESYNIDSASEDAVSMLLQKRLLRLDRALNALIVEPPVLRYFIAHSADL